MDATELYEQKLRGQLAECKAEKAKLKSMSSGAKADAQLKITVQVASIERRQKGIKTLLSKLVEAREDEWYGFKNAVESNWDPLCQYK